MSPIKRRFYLPGYLHALRAAGEWEAGERARQMFSYCFFHIEEETTWRAQRMREMVERLQLTDLALSSL